jgi:hypothetical protein
MHTCQDCSFCDEEMRCPLSWLGDGVCDAVCDNTDCNHDNSDCGSVVVASGNGPTEPPTFSPTEPLPYNCSLYVFEAETVAAEVCATSVTNCYDKFASLAERVNNDQLQQEYLATQQAELDAQYSELNVFITDLELNATALEEQSIALGVVLLELDKQYEVLEDQKQMLEQDAANLSSERDQLIEDTMALQEEKAVLEEDKVGLAFKFPWLIYVSFLKCSLVTTKLHCPFSLQGFVRR